MAAALDVVLEDEEDVTFRIVVEVVGERGVVVEEDDCFKEDFPIAGALDVVLEAEHVDDDVEDAEEEEGFRRLVAFVDQGPQ